MSKRALVIVDAERGFMPAEEGERLGLPGFGELPVDGGHEIVEPTLHILGEYAINGYDVAYTLDFHDPSERIHFETWPPHCVAGTPGSELHPALAEKLATMPQAVEFIKGDKPLEEGEQDLSYSGYFARNRDSGMYLPEFLESRGVEEVDVLGIATDYCVKATALPLRTETGLKVNLVEDGVRGVARETTAEAFREMVAAGIRIVTSRQVREELAQERA